MNLRILGIFVSLTACIICNSVVLATETAENAKRYSWSRDFPATARDNRGNGNNLVLPALRQNSFRDDSRPASPQARAGTCNSCDIPAVTLGAAEVELLEDDDRDGFYQHFEISFDVTSDQPDTPLYVRLYISYEGNQWHFLYRSSDFFITGDADHDRRIIETVLDEGYPTGYYDAKIELYNADTNEFLLDLRDSDERDLRAIPLEDVARDRHDYHFGYYIHGGAINVSSLLALIGLTAFGRKCFRQRNTASRSQHS